MGSLLPLLVVLHDLEKLFIHEGHLDYSLGASISNCGQLGPNLAFPIPKLDHPILVTLNITALDSILIVPRLIILEKWVELMIHPIGVLAHQINAHGTLLE